MTGDQTAQQFPMWPTTHWGLAGLERPLQVVVPSTASRWRRDCRTAWPAGLPLAGAETDSHPQLRRRIQGRFCCRVLSQFLFSNFDGAVPRWCRTHSCDRYHDVMVAPNAHSQSGAWRSRTNGTDISFAKLDRFHIFCIFGACWSWGRSGLPSTLFFSRFHCAFYMGNMGTQRYGLEGGDLHWKEGTLQLFFFMTTTNRQGNARATG